MTTVQKSYLSLREDRYRPIFSQAASFAPIKKLWREALGDQYLEEVDAFGFVTGADLQAIACAVGELEGRTLVDVGCGGGGPGLWVARRTHAALTGIDILQEAIARATVFATTFPEAPQARFQVGGFTRTGLPSKTADAVMSVDAFWMVMDKLAALEEIARIMRPGAVFAMTTWAAADVVWADWFEDTGLRLLSSSETPNWKQNQLTVYGAVCEQRATLEGQLDPEAFAILLSEAEEAPKMLNAMQRYLVIAQRD